MACGVGSVCQRRAGACGRKFQRYSPGGAMLFDVVGNNDMSGADTAACGIKADVEVYSVFAFFIFCVFRIFGTAEGRVFKFFVQIVHVKY